LKRIHLHTNSSSHLVTMGALVFQGIPFLATLERPWRFNEPFKSCLAEGTYLCKRYISKNHPEKRLSWQVQDVHGRTKMLMHTGNWVKNSKGCILPGTGYGLPTAEPKVANSANAMRILADLTNSEDFQLIVHSRG